MRENRSLYTWDLCQEYQTRNVEGCEAGCKATLYFSHGCSNVQAKTYIYVQNMQDPRCAIPARLGITLCVLLEEWCWYNLPSFGVVFA